MRIHALIASRFELARVRVIGGLEDRELTALGKGVSRLGFCVYFEEKSFLQIEIRCVTMSTYGSTTFSNISDRGFSELWKELPIIDSLLDDRGFSELIRELPIAYRLLGERGFRI